jgi:hypothetical protein
VAHQRAERGGRWALRHLAVQVLVAARHGHDDVRALRKCGSVDEWKCGSVWYRCVVQVLVAARHGHDYVRALRRGVQAACVGACACV